MVQVTSFQSTPRVRGESLAQLSRELTKIVSIHAPRAGRKPKRWKIGDDWFVSIHAPRAGRKLLERSHGNVQQQFQSTPRVRGERQQQSQTTSNCPTFQSTPRVRGERRKKRCISLMIVFQSTPRVRGERGVRKLLF